MLTITPSTAFRDAAGRFAKFDGSDLVASRLIKLGDGTTAKLAAASPVRTGFLQSGWTASYAPSSMSLIISDQAPYWIWQILGTRRTPPNADLRAVIAALPQDASVTLRGIGQDWVSRLIGA